MKNSIIKTSENKKTYILKKDCPNIGKERGDYYNGEYGDNIKELLKKEIIEIEEDISENL